VRPLRKLFGRDASVLRQSRFQLLLLSNINGALGIVVVSPILNSLLGPYGVSEVEIGLLITAYTLPGIIGIPVLGVLSDRLGRKRILVVSLLLFGSSGTALSLTTVFPIVLLLRLVQGIGYAGITPIVIMTIGDIYSGNREATAQGLRYTSSGLSEAIFPVVAGALSLVSWRFPFLIYTIAFPVAVAIWFRLDIPHRTEGSPQTGDSSHAPAVYFRRLIRLVRQPKIGFALLALGVPAFFFTAFLTYNSFVVVRVLDGTPEDAGILITVLSVASGAAGSQTGRIAGAFGGRHVPLIGGQAMMGLGLGIFSLASGLLVAALGIAVLGGGLGLNFALLRTIINSHSPREYRGGIVGVGESMIRLSNSVTPLLLGVAISMFSLTMGFSQAVQRTVFLGTLAATLVGTGLLLVYSISTPVEMPQEQPE
jgi:MFS family permease